jgi:ribosomal protein S18 acetylase RimI-like enzyme
MNFKTVEIKHPKYAKQIKDLFRDTYWAKGRTIEEIKVLIKNSTVCMGVVDDNNILVGFSRSMSDLQFVNCIYDIIIRETYKRRNLGKMLIDGITNNPKLKNVKGHVIYCKNHSVSFYEKLGFEENDTLSLMVLKK